MPAGCAASSSPTEAPPPPASWAKGAASPSGSMTKPASQPSATSDRSRGSAQISATALRTWRCTRFCPVPTPSTGRAFTPNRMSVAESRNVSAFSPSETWLPSHTTSTPPPANPISCPA